MLGLNSYTPKPFNNNFFVFAPGRQMGAFSSSSSSVSRYSKWTIRFCISSKIAATISTVYRAKIIQQNGALESTSRQRLVKNVLLHVMQRKRAAPKEPGAHMEQRSLRLGLIKVGLRPYHK